MSVRIVVPERVRNWPVGDDELIYHLPAGPADKDVTWRPIMCGEGITFPYEARVDESEVCPDCKAAKKGARRG